MVHFSAWNFGGRPKSKGFFPKSELVPAGCENTWNRCRGIGEFRGTLWQIRSIVGVFETRQYLRGWTTKGERRRNVEGKNGRWPDSPQPLMFIVIPAFSSWVLIFSPPLRANTARVFGSVKPGERSGFVGSLRYAVWQIWIIKFGQRLARWHHDDTYVRMYVQAGVRRPATRQLERSRNTPCNQAQSRRLLIYTSWDRASEWCVRATSHHDPSSSAKIVNTVYKHGEREGERAGVSEEFRPTNAAGGIAS